MWSYLSWEAESGVPLPIRAGSVSQAGSRPGETWPAAAAGAEGRRRRRREKEGEGKRRQDWRWCGELFLSLSWDHRDFWRAPEVRVWTLLYLQRGRNEVTGPENHLLGACVSGYCTGRAYVSLYSKDNSSGNTDNTSVNITHFLYALCIKNLI